MTEKSQLTEMSHNWKYYPRFKLTCCEFCGIVKRADGKNGPCKGPSSIVLKENTK